MRLIEIEPQPAELAPPKFAAPLPPAGWKRALAAALGVWLLTSIYMVRADEQAVVTRFGAVVEPRVLPG
ncbi:MAG: hypothetical protein ACRD96_04935, partial [Bryobacteraceae bacterium]